MASDGPLLRVFDIATRREIAQIDLEDQLLLRLVVSQRLVLALVQTPGDSRHETLRAYALP